MIIQELVARYEREATRGRVAPYGYSMERVNFVLILDREGRAIDVQDMRDGKTAPRMQLPTPPKSASAIAPRYLYGNSAYVLGVLTEAQMKKLPDEKETEKDPEAAEAAAKKVEQRCSDEHAAWKSYHLEVLDKSEDEGLRAVLRFIANWTPEQVEGLHYADEIRSGTIALRLDGDTHANGDPRFISDRQAAKEIWEHQASPTDAETGVCCITGKVSPIARLHPSIKGVKGTNTSGASLVSFNVECAEKYGAGSQGLNAPVSNSAVHAYTTALNALLASEQHRIRIGDATAVLWTEAVEANAAHAQDLLAALLGGGSVTMEEGETAALRDVLVQIAAGRPLSEADPDLDPATRYHVLAFGPAMARLIVRWHLSGTLGDLARRVGEHWYDMALDPLPWKTPPSVQWLALQTVPARPNKTGGYDRDKDDVNPTLPGEVLRSILTGQRYPSGLLQTLVQRLGTDGDKSGLRIAMIRACLARDHRLGISHHGAPMALEPDNPSVPYQLGRLLAVLGNAYRLANPESDGGPAENSYRMAATQPGAAFPRLLATARHHLSAIRRNGKGGLAHVIDAEIGDISARIGSEFPRVLNVADQGRFALGFYHQRNHRKTTSDKTENT